MSARYEHYAPRSAGVTCRRCGQKIASTMLAKQWVQCLQYNALRSLERAGYFVDPLQVQVELKFMPSVYNGTVSELEHQDTCQKLVMGMDLLSPEDRFV